MAATASKQKNKSRLDFSAAIDEALFNDSEKGSAAFEEADNSSAGYGEAAHIDETENENRDDMETVAQESKNTDFTETEERVQNTQAMSVSQENKTQSSVTAQEDRDVNQEKSSTGDAVREQTRHVNVSAHSRLNLSFLDDDDEDDAAMFLSLAKGNTGVQRSVYFEGDVYEYLQSKSKKYNVKFSNVVNLLLKEAILKK